MNERVSFKKESSPVFINLLLLHTYSFSLPPQKCDFTKTLTSSYYFG